MSLIWYNRDNEAAYAQTQVFEEGFEYCITPFINGAGENQKLMVTIEGSAAELLIEMEGSDAHIFETLDAAKAYCEKLELGWRENADKY